MCVCVCDCVCVMVVRCVWLMCGDWCVVNVCDVMCVWVREMDLLVNDDVVVVVVVMMCEDDVMVVIDGVEMCEMGDGGDIDVLCVDEVWKLLMNLNKKWKCAVTFVYVGVGYAGM